MLYTILKLLNFKRVLTLSNALDNYFLRSICIIQFQYKMSKKGLNNFRKSIFIPSFPSIHLFNKWASNIFFCISLYSSLKKKLNKNTVLWFVKRHFKSYPQMKHWVEQQKGKQTCLGGIQKLRKQDFANFWLPLPPS